MPTSINAVPYGNRDGTVLANVLENDFLGNHLESMLIRQPESRDQQPINIIENPSGSTSKRTSRGSLSSVNKEVPSSPPRSNINIIGYSNHMSPGDGIFGTGLPAKAAAGGGHSTIQQGRIGSNGYDYFNRNGHGSNQPPSSSGHRHNSSSASISTSFGRRTSLRSTQQASGSGSSNNIHNRSGSLDQVDVMSDASSAQRSSKGSLNLLEPSMDRRASDGTDVTSITSPTAISDGSWSRERETCSAFKADGSEEGEDVGYTPVTPFSPSQGEESGDQTTWERFKRGGVIEPPEAEPLTPISASWINGEALYPSYTCISSKRRGSGSPGRDTIKADAMDTRNNQPNSVTLVPYGSDGRTFRFTNRNEQLAVSRMKQEKAQHVIEKLAAQDEKVSAEQVHSST